MLAPSLTSTRPLRIAVYHDLPSGGAKRTLMETARRLAGRHALEVYTLGCANHDFADIRPWVARHEVVPFTPSTPLPSPFGRVNPLLRLADLARLDRVARAIAQRIDDRRYDVALVHPCQFEQAPSVLRHLRRTPSAYYCHEPLRLLHESMPSRPYDGAELTRRRMLNAIDPLPGLYRRRLTNTERQNTRAARMVLVNSGFTAAAVDRVFGVQARVSYHGVDTAVFTPTGAARRDFVLSVGSLTPLKGFDFLIESLALVPAAVRPRLVIVSNFQNPPEREYLMALATRAGVRLELRGTVDEAELVRLYNEARFVVYAPVREPFGLVALEAMACGTAIVAVAEGGVAESVIDGVTGLLTARVPAAFASAVERLIVDPTLAGRFGAWGRDHALAFWSWDRAVATIEAHLAGCAGGTRPAGAAGPSLASSVAGTAPVGR